MIIGAMPLSPPHKGGIIVIGLRPKDLVELKKQGHGMRDFKLAATMITRSPYPDNWECMVVMVGKDETVDTAIKRVVGKYGVAEDQISSIEIHDRLHGKFEKET